MNKLSIVAAVLAGLYLALCVLLFFVQRALVFPAPKSGVAPRVAQVIHLDGGGLLLWIPPPAPDATVLLHFHGNAEQAADSEGLAEAFHVGLAIVEYPGYGLLAEQGSPSEERLTAAGLKAADYLTKQLEIPPSRLIVSGQSIGTGVAVAVASRGIGSKLLLLSPYTSLPDAGASAMPFIPVRLLMRDRFDSAALAPGIKVPVLIVHGTEDEVIPYALGKRLSALFPHARLLSVAGAHHNDLWSFREVHEQIAHFLAP